MTQPLLQMTIGPVQGFVSLSRRTRDLWSSSFLLSYLAGQCMRYLVQKGGTIVLPDVANDDMFRKICDPKVNSSPDIGSLPNRFQARFPAAMVPQELNQIAANARDALIDAWQNIANDIWSQYVQPAEERGEKTRAIWDRQVQGFWDVQWVIHDDPTLLAQRKNWRSHLRPNEPGDKCTLMYNWQELSGHIRSSHPGNRKKQDAFWSAVQGKIGYLDLRDNERLCAVALIKRLFPKRSQETIGWDVQSISWPSTSYIAAAPWIAEVKKHQPQRAREYADLLHDVLKDKGATSTGKKSYIRALEAWKGERFPSLDGRLYFLTGLENERLVVLKDGKEGQRSLLQGKLRELYQSLAGDTQKQLGPPSPYYAVLLMDGDSLGSLCRDLADPATGQNPLSEALHLFTSQVKQVVAEHDGVVIYAGGDDLLAMLPMTTALGCASAVSSAYRGAFRQVLGSARYEEFQSRATISAGLVFAHHQAPLHTMLKEAHQLLDDVAKDGCGRDSIAISVWKPSGKMCQYSSTWSHLQNVRPVHVNGAPLLWNQTTPATQLEQLAALLHNRDADQVDGFSASFVYRLREQLGLLCGWPHWEPGAFGSLQSLGDAFDINTFLSAEVIRCLRIAGYDEEELDHDEVREQTGLLLRASQRSFRKAKGLVFAHHNHEHELGMDAALLARFLARGGVRGDENHG